MRGTARSAWTGALLLCVAGIGGDGLAQDATPPSPAKELVAQLADPDASKRQAAADALVQLGAEGVPELAAGLQDRALREAIAAVIVRLGPVAKDAAPTLANLLRGPASGSRPALVKAAAALGAEGAPAVPALAAIVVTEKAPDRMVAAEALGRVLSESARRAPRKDPPAKIRKAIDAGCDWLVRHQAESGLWDCDGFSARCAGDPACGGPGDEAYDGGVTGLAVLALLRCGGDPDPGRDGAAEKGVRALLALQRADGRIAASGAWKAIYEHGAAAQAVIERLRRGDDPETRKAAQRAVDFVVEQRNTNFVWRYDGRNNDNDTSVTVWMTDTLAAAEQAGLRVDPGWKKGASDWLQVMTNRENARTGYQQKGGPSARTSEMQAKFPASYVEALTACAVQIRLDADLRGWDADILGRQAEMMRAKPPLWDAAGHVDFYYWMHGAAAMRRTGGAPYAEWRSALLDSLLPHQQTPRDGCAAGSWPPVDPWSTEGGRVYSTTAALLALESAMDDPASLPAVPGSVRPAMNALAKIVADGYDPDARDVAYRALTLIRAEHKP